MIIIGWTLNGNLLEMPIILAHIKKMAVFKNSLSGAPNSCSLKTMYSFQIRVHQDKGGWILILKITRGNSSHKGRVLRDDLAFWAIFSNICHFTLYAAGRIGCCEQANIMAALGTISDSFWLIVIKNKDLLGM